MVCVFVFKFFIRGLKMCGGGRAGEAAQQLRALVAFAGDSYLVPISCMLVHNHSHSSFRGSDTHI